MPASHPDPHSNRESWLNNVANRLRPAFAQLGAPLPDRLRIAIGFPSTGRRAKATGECWDSTASADATFEILVRPDLAEAEGALALPVATALARELVHAAVGISAGRGTRLPHGRPRHQPPRTHARHKPRTGLPCPSGVHPRRRRSPASCQAPGRPGRSHDGCSGRHRRLGHHQPAQAGQPPRQVHLPCLRLRCPHRPQVDRPAWTAPLPPARAHAAGVGRVRPGRAGSWDSPVTAKPCSLLIRSRATPCAERRHRWPGHILVLKSSI